VNTKIQLGQFYTRGNPFQYSRAQKWFSVIPNLSGAKIVEPFAGSNSIVALVNSSVSKLSPDNWQSFDIHPEAIEANLVPEIRLQKRDTLEDFPRGFDVAITNPPYLAKNSATRKRMIVHFGEYQDTFEVALHEMLSNCDWVAAIIPESFITRKLFKDRLDAAISLNHEMFDDTEFPVCLALFSPNSSNDFEIWRGEQFLGYRNALDNEVENLLTARRFISPRFNAPNGEIGLIAIDNTTGASIKFVDGATIPSDEIKVTSRSLTRISIDFLDAPLDPDKLIAEANQILTSYRSVSSDVFLTAFKGLRADNAYRRRIDWKTAGRILNKAASNISS
jgi:hypothetical protein